MKLGGRDGFDSKPLASGKIAQIECHDMRAGGIGSEFKHQIIFRGSELRSPQKINGLWFANSAQIIQQSLYVLHGVPNGQRLTLEHALVFEAKSYGECGAVTARTKKPQERVRSPRSRAKRGVDDTGIQDDAHSSMVSPAVPRLENRSQSKTWLRVSSTFHARAWAGAGGVSSGQLLKPVLDPQSWHPLELADVVGDEWQPCT